MSTISLSMIVKNEENHLRECLESVNDIVDEIIIVDTGSTDSTLKIAAQFTAKIFNYKWTNDFSAARNFALSKTTGEWILYLDADERLCDYSKKELLQLTKSNDKLGINCIINNLDDYKNSPKLMKYIRLFRNNENIRFTSKAHEQIEPSLFTNNYRIIDSSIEIIHHGYNVPEEELKIKASRNLELLLIDYLESPTSYLSFQIANSYSILEETENSILYYRKALDDINLRREFKSVCYLHLTDHYMRKNDFSSAKTYIDKGLKADKNHTLLNMIASQVYEKLNEKGSSLLYCKNAYELNKKLKNNSNTKNVLDIIIDNKKILLEGILTSLKFRSNNDLEYFLTSLKIEGPDYFKVINTILSNNIKHEESLEILIRFVNENNIETILKFLKYNSNNEFKLDLFSRIYDKFNNHSNYLTNFGSFLISINQLAEARIILEQALSNNDYDDAVIFYLASIYTSTNDFEELKNLLKIADIKAKSNKLLQSRLTLLKDKLRPLL